MAARRPVHAFRIDAAPYAWNSTLKRVKPDRRKALLLLIGRLARGARHRKDEIRRADTIRVRGLVEIGNRHAPIEQSLDETPSRRIAAENVIEPDRVCAANVYGGSARLTV